MAEEEVTDTRASATAARVQASGEFSAVANPYGRLSPFLFLFLDFKGILSVIVLEEQLAASHHEVEGAHLWEGLLNEDHHRGMVPDTRRGAGAGG